MSERNITLRANEQFNVKLTAEYASATGIIHKGGVYRVLGVKLNFATGETRYRLDLPGRMRFTLWNALSFTRTREPLTSTTGE